MKILITKLKIIIILPLIFKCTPATNLDRGLVDIGTGLCSFLKPTIEIDKKGHDKRILKNEVAIYTVHKAKKLISIDTNSLPGLNNTARIISDNEFEYKANVEGCDDLKITYLDHKNQKVQDIANISIGTEAEITYVIYLAGDNNLNGGIGSYNKSQDMVLKDLIEIEKAEVGMGNVNVIMFIDVSSAALNEYIKNRNSITRTGLYKLIDKKLVLYKAFPQKDTSKDLVRTPEIDTGREETLKQCLDEAYYISSSPLVFLDMWGHGDSLIGVAFDKGNSNDRLKPSDIRRVIEASKFKHIDILNFSACLMMSMEVIYELKDVVKFVVGSPEYIPGDGSYYSGKNGILDWLSKNYSKDLKDITIEIARMNFNSYQVNGGQYKSDAKYFKFLSYSAVELKYFNNELIDNMKDLFSKIDELSLEKAVNKSLSYGKKSYDTGRNDPGYFYDFLDLLENLKDDRFLLEPIQKLKGSLEKLIIYNRSALSFYDKPFKSGLSIYYKKSFLGNPFRDSSKFGEITNWDRFLYNN